MTGLKIMPVALLAMSLTGTPLQKNKGAGSGSGAAAGFALVELFTSEGCSSCPPADEAVAALNKEYGNRVYVLGFHVDYWDRLGWKDVYSNGDYTARQRQYAEAFHLNSIYTPQIVVNGKKEFVGSDKARLKAAIEYELGHSVNREIALQASGKDGKTITVSYKLSPSPGYRLSVALVQQKAVSRVLAGENKAHTLEHVNVVRDLRTVSAGKEETGSIDLKMPVGLAEKDCKVIAFLQKEADGQIAGVGETMPVFPAKQVR